MSYLSPEFALVFLGFLILYWGLVRWPRAQKLSLLTASYAIYASIDWRFAAILAVFSTILTGLMALSAQRPAWRRGICGTGVVLAVANLAVFKYYDFFREGIQQLAAGAGLHWAFPALDILLPVGISFYTFQAIAYLVSVAKGQCEPARAEESALYLAFFPTLFAGPICRADNLLNQIRDTAQKTILAPDLAVYLLLSALVKKVWIATWVAENWVNPLFANPDSYQGIELIVGMYAFAIQIFLDFSGYSDLVIALALLLGYQLPQNFDQPYLARNLRDFWRRWHISLSSWIRDFVYIPLGGNRHGWLRSQVNIFTAMLISGLWHGASLKYLIWGGMHGLGMVAQNTLEKVTRRTPSGWISAVLSFHAVCFAWVYFRADSFQDANHYIGGMLRTDGPVTLNVLAALVALGMFFVISVYARRMQELLVRGLAATPLLIKPLLLAAVVLVLHLLGPSGVPAFLYYSY